MTSNKGTILVADDNPAVLEPLTYILAAEGYVVHPADGGESALAVIAACEPELILLDVYMPGLDGFEVLRRIKARAETPDVPVIFISAGTEVEQRVQGLRLGAVDFITKPFQPEELLARVHTHLELRRTSEALRREIGERKRAEAERERLITELQSALAEVKTLTGIIPICAGCKKIRDDRGFWDQVESYISKHSFAKFSHGLCPDCADVYFPHHQKSD